MDSVHLIVGLGNPGSKYARTRHNAGFLVVDELASRWAVSLREERKFEARLGLGQARGQKVLLAQPLTFMNASGTAVRKLKDYYRVPDDQWLVVLDDADLPLGEIRLRLSGGSGGHHGLESLAEHAGNSDFIRLRVGIGRADGLREITGHVLGEFGQGDEALVRAVMKRAADQVECWLESGIQKAMNDFNGMIDHPENKGTGQ